MRRLLLGFFFTMAACAPAPRPAPKERPAPAPAPTAPPPVASAPPSVAAEPLASACNAGDLARCAELGGKLHASGVREQVARAVPLLEKACKGGVASACNTLGHAYRRGGEVERDHEKSLVYFRTGCEAGEGRVLACVGLADVYIDGLGAEVDRARAVGILEPACEGDVPLACSRLGLIHTTGMGVPDDEAHHRIGAKYYDKACRLGEAGACVHLANLYRNGIGVPFDPRKARGFFQKACDAGDDFACAELEEKPRKGDNERLP